MMSKERLLDLLTALEKYGWQIELEDDESFEESFIPDKDQQIMWRLFRNSHKKGKTRISLCFSIFGPLGERSDNLNDILYCDAPGDKLYFSKRTDAQWPKDLAAFVNTLYHHRPPFHLMRCD
ncbi:MAG: hypothetical protein K2X93_10895 [Candidatus Obscuribacterales bacterium]|nr:hypothetical protein [Candidatus Obscuribacterales bacterium]